MKKKVPLTCAMPKGLCRYRDIINLLFYPSYSFWFWQ